MLAQALRPGRTDKLDEFLVGGVADACDGAEMPEQRLDCAGADTGDAFEFASEKVVAAFLAVEGDATLSLYAESTAERPLSTQYDTSVYLRCGRNDCGKTATAIFIGSEFAN